MLFIFFLSNFFLFFCSKSHAEYRRSLRTTPAETTVGAQHSLQQLRMTSSLTSLHSTPTSSSYFALSTTVKPLQHKNYKVIKSSQPGTGKKWDTQLLFWVPEEVFNISGKAWVLVMCGPTAESEQIWLGGMSSWPLFLHPCSTSLQSLRHSYVYYP